MFTFVFDVTKPYCVLRSAIEASLAAAASCLYILLAFMYLSICGRVRALAWIGKSVGP